MKEKRRVGYGMCCLFLATLPTSQSELRPDIIPYNNIGNGSVWGDVKFARKLAGKTKLSLPVSQVAGNSNIVKNEQHIQLTKKHVAQVSRPQQPKMPQDQHMPSSRGSSLMQANLQTDKQLISDEALQQTIKTTALGYLGFKYRWGGTNPKSGFDCSGFTQFVFQSLGIALPRTSFEQYQKGFAVAQKDLLPGDLLFFSTYAKGASHVGIYIGNGSFIHCLNANTGVVVSRLGDSYYQQKFVGAKRLTVHQASIRNFS